MWLFLTAFLLTLVIMGYLLSIVAARFPLLRCYARRSREQSDFLKAGENE